MTTSLFWHCDCEDETLKQAHVTVCPYCHAHHTTARLATKTEAMKKLQNDIVVAKAMINRVRQEGAVA